MKASELRIGNFYDNNGFVSVVSPNTIEEVWNAERSWVKPIPLTEEWLIRLGFEKKSWFTKDIVIECVYYQLNDIVVYLFKDSFEIELIKQGGQFNLFINFKKEVHILQNLIHALKNTDLECTSK